MTAKSNTGKWQLLIMIGMVVGVLIAGYLIFPKTEQQRAELLENIGTTNHGQLLMEPLPIEALPLQSLQGQPWNFSEQKPKWRLFIFGDDVCANECGEMLQLSRQVHLLLGKKSHRFERVYVTSTTTLQLELASRIESEHPYLKVEMVDGKELEQWLDSDALVGVPRDGMTLLVDQKGMAMMRYGPESQGSGMLEDINHLLKYSPGT